MSNQAQPETEISEDLKKELISISYATTPIYNENESESETIQTFIDSVRKYFAPNFHSVMDGCYSLNLEQYIEGLIGSQITMANFHDQKFTRSGDTIITQGLVDTTWVRDGKHTEWRDQWWCDIYVRGEERWLMLASFFNTQPVSVADYLK